MLSPDGHWIAFASDETGPYQLYVQPYPGPGPRVQISREGGGDVWWSPDGRRIFWCTADFRALWRADVTPGTTFNAAPPVRLAALPPGILSIDLTPDRTRFLALAPDAATSGSMSVVQNWHRAIEKGR